VTQWQYTYGSNPYIPYGSTVRPRPRLSTSPKEVLHVVVAAAVLSGCIALISLRSLPLYGPAAPSTSALRGALAFGAAAALTGFVFHELAHKVAAQRLGYWAEFRMSPSGLILAVVTAVIGFLFAAPGATMVGGMSDRRDWGWTSLAGPTVNLIQGTAFFGAALVLWQLDVLTAVLPALVLLAFFNGWFATFNLIPFGPLDGNKVLHWNMGYWAGAFALSAGLAASMFLLFSGIIPL